MIKDKDNFACFQYIKTPIYHDMPRSTRPCSQHPVEIQKVDKVSGAEAGGMGVYIPPNISDFCKF